MPRKTRGGAARRRGVRRGFNEAAARCRGKHQPPSASAGRRRRFNEAAARCRGKPRTVEWVLAGLWQLQ